VGNKSDLALLERLINQERQAVGALPLSRDPRLDHIALRQVAYLLWCGSLHPERRDADRQTIDCRLQDAAIPFDRCGENLVMGASAREIIQKLLVGGRHDILHPSYGRLGLASRVDSDEDVPDWFAQALYCLVFIG
jgi:uncharacterized protein YkwD